MTHEAGYINAIPTRGQAIEQVQRVFAQTGRYPSGICRYCGCVEERACVDVLGRPCGWMDEARTRCSSLVCIHRFELELANEIAES